MNEEESMYSRSRGFYASGHFASYVYMTDEDGGSAIYTAMGKTVAEAEHRADELVRWLNRDDWVDTRKVLGEQV